MPRSWLVAFLGLAACRAGQRHCLGGYDGACLPAAACPARPSLGACGAPPGALRVGLVDRAPRGVTPKTAAADGDFLLENDRVRVVIAAPERPQGLAPSGGSLLDLALIDGGGDHLNSVYHAAGVLPRDAVRYRRAQAIDGSPDFVALVVRGHLDGNPRVEVVTRYELRPCEAGVRVRTELWNGGAEVNTFALTDGFFWGDRGLLPFVPLRGQGFHHPKLDLLELSESWRSWPYLAARPQAEPFTAYAVVPCAASRASGFNDPTLSAAGVHLAPTLPEDALAHERFILAAPGPGLASAVGEALRARADFHGEPLPGKVRGRVVAGAYSTPIDGRAGRAASLLFYQPAAGDDPDAARCSQPPRHQKARDPRSTEFLRAASPCSARHTEARRPATARSWSTAVPPSSARARPGRSARSSPCKRACRCPPR